MNKIFHSKNFPKISYKKKENSASINLRSIEIYEMEENQFDFGRDLMFNDHTPHMLTKTSHKLPLDNSQFFNIMGLTLKVLGLLENESPVVLSRSGLPPRAREDS